MSDSMQAALLRLGSSLAEAAGAALEAAAPGPITVGEVGALLDYASVESHVTRGTVVVDASSVDGAAGRTLLLLAPAAARALLAQPAEDVAPSPTAAPPSAEVEAEPKPEPEPVAGAETGGAGGAGRNGPLSAAELTAIGQFGDRLNTAAANALSLLLGQQVDYEPAEASTVEDPRFVVRPGPVQAICASFQGRDGECCRLIQFAPNALVMRAARAFEEIAEHAAHRFLGGEGTGPSAQALGEIRLRVWAELGRTELGLSRALQLPLGAVVELDREADAAVDLFVNGMRFGSGRLMVTDEGEWALALDEVGPARAVAAGASDH